MPAANSQISHADKRSVSIVVPPRVPFFGYQAELPRRLISQGTQDRLIWAFTERSFDSHKPQWRCSEKEDSDHTARM